jgi:hypothetical protein
MKTVQIVSRSEKSVSHTVLIDLKNTVWDVLFLFKPVQIAEFAFQVRDIWFCGQG